MFLACWLGLAWSGVEEALLEARLAEREGQPERARAACLEVVAQASVDEPAGYRCSQRLDYLEARQDADGGLDGLRLLEQARRDEVNDLRVLRVHPSDSLRREAGLWESRRVDASEALVLLAGLWAEVSELPDAPLREEVGRRYAELLTQAGRLDEAATVEAGWRTPPGPHEGVARARLEQRRGGLAIASGAALGLFLLVAAPLGWRARQERPRLLGLMPLSLVVLLCAALAAAWELQAGLTVLLLLPGFAAVHVASAFALIGSRRGLKVAVRVLALLATLGVLGLVLSWRQGWGWLGL